MSQLAKHNIENHYSVVGITDHLKSTFSLFKYYLPRYVDINLCVRCTNPPSTSSKNILSEDYCKGHSPKRQKMGHVSQHSDSNASDMAMGRPGHNSEVRRLSLDYRSEIPSPSDIGVKISSCNLHLAGSPPPGDIKGVKLTELARHSPGDRDGKFSASASTSNPLVRRTKVGNLSNALDCTGVHCTSKQSSVICLIHQPIMIIPYMNRSTRIDSPRVHSQEDHVIAKGYTIA